VLLRQEPVEELQQEELVELVLAIDSAAALAGVLVSKLASVFAFHDFCGSPHAQVHKLDTEHPYNGDNDSKHSAN